MSTKKAFTPDGVSGRAITEISCEMILRAGRALALILSNRLARKPKILIGRDTRISSDIFCAAFSAGCCSAGADAHILGVLPTAGVSELTKRYGADAGVMITAAHNSFEFNGIVFFGPDGGELRGEILSEVERLTFSDKAETLCSGGDNIGTITHEKNAEWDYVRGLLKETEADLARMRVVIDCANGAAYTAAEKFFRGIGAGITLINNAPDGKNINLSCGTTDLSSLSKAVIENRAHAGVALDGDGGRCLMVDEKGNPISGDIITAILADYMKREQKLAANTCVVSQTVNLGFFRWAKENGIVVSQAPEVGLRYIIERMETGDYNLGGSASGHTVFGKKKTADGMLTAARILEVLSKSKKRMSELSALYEPYPRFTLNIPLRPEYRTRWQDVPALKEMISYCQQKLEGDGRVLVRESSTSPILRIIAEGRDKELVWQYAQAIAKTAADYVGTGETDENG